MYALYRKSRVRQGHRYRLKQPVKLFGCNEGLIPRLLSSQLRPSHREPYKWHVEVGAALARSGHPRSCLVIDLKPKQREKNVSLYEILDVWGYSSDGWTPLLLHLSGLHVDSAPRGIDRDDFQIKSSTLSGPIYEFIYLRGSIGRGKLAGRWTAPPASPTNAALLWPESLTYFVERIRERTPGVLP